MKKTALAILLGAMLCMAVSPAWAEYVYVTKNGKKFHHAESKFIQNRETEKITVEEALARGLEPSKAYLKHKASAEQTAAESPKTEAKKK
jgi:hypothetical protein